MRAAPRLGSPRPQLLGHQGKPPTGARQRPTASTLLSLTRSRCRWSPRPRRCAPRAPWRGRQESPPSVAGASPRSPSALLFNPHPLQSSPCAATGPRPCFFSIQTKPPQERDRREGKRTPRRRRRSCGGGAGAVEAPPPSEPRVAVETDAAARAKRKRRRRPCQGEEGCQLGVELCHARRRLRTQRRAAALCPSASATPRRVRLLAGEQTTVWRSSRRTLTSTTTSTMAEF
ncbi:hypothetical protein BS78_03G271700 [Paspalum vaginatum]|nr:hypothetical protein BS78_03G271700 [Paspalum vaginatum]